MKVESNAYNKYIDLLYKQRCILLAVMLVFLLFCVNVFVSHKSNFRYELFAVLVLVVFGFISFKIKGKFDKRSVGIMFASSGILLNKADNIILYLLVLLLVYLEGKGYGLFFALLWFVIAILILYYNIYFPLSFILGK